MTIKSCIKCGKEIRISPSQLKRNKGKFCSRICAFGEKIWKNCDMCSSKFFTHKCKIEQGKGKHCSRKCYELYKRTLPAWNKGKPAEWMIGNQYRKGKTNPNPHKMFGKDNPKWKEGITLGDKRKGYFSFKSLERYNKKRNVGDSHTYHEWLELKKKYNFYCLSCRKKESEIVLTQDHILPIALGGNDNINNIQPLCNNCNSKKWKTYFDFRPF